MTAEPTDAEPLPADARAVLDYWFGAPGSAEHGRPRELWWRKSAATDAEITERFGALIERALRGELAGWAAQPRGALAQVIVLDQLTRNVGRDTPRAFAGDALALAAARAMVAAGADLALAPIERSFVYMPFEHAENLAMQDEAVRLFTQLAAVSGEPDDMLDYARRHRAVVQRFGRFPHRNAILGRLSSADEIAFLQEPGSRF